MIVHSCWDIAQFFKRISIHEPKNILSSLTYIINYTVYHFQIKLDNKSLAHTFFFFHPKNTDSFIINLSLFYVQSLQRKCTISPLFVGACNMHSSFYSNFQPRISVKILALMNLPEDKCCFDNLFHYCIAIIKKGGAIGTPFKTTNKIKPLVIPPNWR